MAGMLVKKVPPDYPEDAKNDHVQGTVALKVIVDKQGNVANIQVVSGPERLAPAAIEGVKQWKYKPYLLNGNPVEVGTQVQMNFTLAD
jgi:protein TonB